MRIFEDIKMCYQCLYEILDTGGTQTCTKDEDCKENHKCETHNGRCVPKDTSGISKYL